MYDKNRTELEKIVDNLSNQYNFVGLIHVTDFENFKKIYKSGFLKSRYTILEEIDDFVDSASGEVLSKAGEGVKSCVRFYYRPKTPTFYNNEGIKVDNQPPHMPIPVCLVFKGELIYLPDTYFSDGNATNYETCVGNDHVFFSLIDWDKVFHTGSFNRAYRNEYVRKRQAELLSRNPVPLDYLSKVIFRCQADYNRAVHILGENRLFVVDVTMFHNMNNYIKDYNIETTNNKITLRCSYNFKNNDKYKHFIRAFDDDGVQIYSWEPKLPNDKNTITFTLNNYKSNWGKIEYLMNDHIVIEQYFREYRNLITDYQAIFYESENSFKLGIEFRDLSFKRYKHTIKVFNDADKLQFENKLNFIDNEKLRRRFTFDMANDEWKRYEYYINNKLCFTGKMSVNA